MIKFLFPVLLDLSLGTQRNQPIHQNNLDLSSHFFTGLMLQKKTRKISPVQNKQNQTCFYSTLTLIKWDHIWMKIRFWQKMVPFYWHLNTLWYLGQNDIIAFGYLNINFRISVWNAIHLNRNNNVISDFSNLSQTLKTEVFKRTCLFNLKHFHCWLSKSTPAEALFWGSGGFF